MVDINPEDIMPPGLLPQTNIIEPGIWGDPKIWLIAAGLLVIITIVMIYYKVFRGEKRP